ncbi:MAG: hypothetical protein KDA45_06620, partial [Planctomycetales bacterium]|nr:hypothetical protein [Planctomycetales bacterium]
PSAVAAPVLPIDRVPGTKPLAGDASARNPTAVHPATVHPATVHPATVNPAAVNAAVRSTGAGRRRQRGHRWLLPLIGGCGCLIVLLVALLFSGVLQPQIAERRPDQPPPYVPSSPEAEPTAEGDPRAALYRIVASAEHVAWVPPAVPQAIPLDMLPPGGQCFISFRPAELLASPVQRRLLAGFDAELMPLLTAVARQAGAPLEQLAQVTAAFYPPREGERLPQYCLRCELATPQPLQALREAWQQPDEEPVGAQTLLRVSPERTYYVAPQPLLGAQQVSVYSVGSLELMRGVIELEGGRGPLLSAVEKLWQVSDRQADLSLLVSPRFLFTEGRGWLEEAPDSMAQRLRSLLGNNLRAALLQTRFEPQWYVETQWRGASDRDAGRILGRLQTEIRDASSNVEDWLLNHTPHPFWRALALRLPLMLRAVAEATRYAVEDGTVVANAYLPSEAAANVLLASWLAWQPAATAAMENTGQSDGPPVGEQGGGGNGVSTSTRQLTLEQYLARPIALRFEQEPIEVALQMVAEEANSRLPPGTPPLPFVLDGAAFRQAGITRNQQLRDFVLDKQSVRQGLTEIARRGNPDPTVTDLRQPEQRLVWVVAEPTPGSPVVRLTTRAAAMAAGTPLPVEFAPES